jgi:hypothetical protein
MDDAFIKCKHFLDAGRPVCFSGTPCQVAGLKAFLRKEYELLTTVDVICHGVASPILWKKGLNDLVAKYAAKPLSVRFRNKTYGYHSSTMRVLFENGKVYSYSGRIDPILKSYFSEIASRPSCYKCVFKSASHASDLTIFDAWHASDLVEELKDDDQGYTNLLVQSPKGVRVLAAIQPHIKCYPVDTERAIAADGIMARNQAKPHPMRQMFYNDFMEESFQKHTQKLIPVTPKDYAVEKAKKVLYRLGIMKRLKKSR